MSLRCSTAAVSAGSQEWGRASQDFEAAKELLKASGAVEPGDWGCRLRPRGRKIFRSGPGGFWVHVEVRRRSSGEVSNGVSAAGQEWKDLVKF